jgi:DNA polymerase III epsilon subunit-like protein
LLQLAWQIRDRDGTLLHCGNIFVRPDGFAIPEAAARVHGITEAFLAEQNDTLCQPIASVLNTFFAALRDHRVGCLVAHNLTFDFHCIYYELWLLRRVAHEARAHLAHWKSLTGYCTYKQGRRLLKSYRPGKLTDFYSYFVEPWETSELKHSTTLHRADSDVEVCRRLYERIYPQTVASTTTPQ